MKRSQKAIPSLHVPVCREEKILETIQVSKQILQESQLTKPMSLWEFLYTQSHFIRKRWWAFQAVLLVLVCGMLPDLGQSQQIRSILGIAAPLMVVLTIPELWRNRNADAMDIESTTYYTIRQVYAARMTLFSSIDLMLITVFLAISTTSHWFTLWEGMVHFVLPFNVTCCICIRTLYSPKFGSETLSMTLCFLFTGIWAMLMAREDLYQKITVPIWAALLGLSLLYLLYAVSQGQKKWSQFMEVKPYGITN